MNKTTNCIPYQHTAHFSLEHMVKPAPGGWKLVVVLSLTLISPATYASKNYGLDPFHQGEATTLYWGSGDVNSDGQVTSADLKLAEEMAAGSRESSCLADVNGDGIINDNDLLLFNKYLQKTIDYLPGWWNSLKSADERKQWLLRAIATDRTDTLEYDTVHKCWFICGHFSMQTALRLSGVPGTLHDNLIEAGQIGWNIPVYKVSVNLTLVGHAINAVLIGDNPMNFNDWYFFEPQDDSVVIPGGWNLQPGKISIESVIAHGKSVGGLPVAVFTMNNDLTCSFDTAGSSKSLITKNSGTVPATIDNSISEWRFKCVSNGHDFIISNRARNDLSGNNDIYIADFDDTRNGYFPTDSRYTYLLDACKGNGSILYLLWREKTAINKPSLFAGTYDLSEKKFISIDTLSHKGGTRFEGKLLYKDDTNIFAFWTESYGIGGADPNGIYCSMYNGLTAGSHWRMFTFDKEHELEMSPCFFDATLTRNGDILFVYRNRGGVVFQKQFFSHSGTWSDSSSITDTSEVVQDVNIIKTADGKLHLFYTVLDKDRIQLFVDESGKQYNSALYDMLGKIKHRVFSGDMWSAPEDAGLGELLSSPSSISDADGTIYMTFVSYEMPVYKVAVNQYKNGSWSKLLSVSESNKSAPQWPRLHISSQHQLIALWETNNNDKSTISRKVVTSNPVYEASVIERKIAKKVNQTCTLNGNQIVIRFFQNAHTAHTITIMDLTGRILLKKSSAIKQKAEYIRVRQYGQGALLVKIDDGSHVNTHKLVHSGL